MKKEAYDFTEAPEEEDREDYTRVTFGALPPTNAQWQVGKSVSELKAIRKAQQEADAANVTPDLENACKEIKNRTSQACEDTAE